MMKPTAVALGLSWLACLFVGAGLGLQIGRSPLQAELAQLRTTHAETARLAAQASARQLQAAQVRGDALTHDLAQRQVQIDQLHQDKRHALTRVTTGRPCLSLAAVRLLNAEQADDPSDYGAPSVPQATGSPDAAHATTATDADVGGWAIAARAQYNTCRARLAALIDWHGQPPSTLEP